MKWKGLEPRLLFTAIFFTVVMMGLGARLAFLHLWPHAHEIKVVEDSRDYERVIPCQRGRIYDCHEGETLLALDMMRKDVCVDPRVVVRSNAVEQVAMAVSESIALPMEDIRRRLTQAGRKYVRLARFIDVAPAEQLKKMKLPGFFFPDSPCRTYPNGAVGAHVLGFVNYERVGVAGVEMLLEKHLQGTNGMLESQKNGLQEEMFTRRGQYVSPVNGCDVSLTLDLPLQYIVEKALDEAMETSHAQGAWVIIQRVRTGEILAMAARPGFDPNLFQKASPEERLNRSIGVVYEPGSTFKAVAVSAALNEGTVTENTVFDCENGHWLYCKHILRDFHPYGNLTVADGIKKSSNILTAKVAIQLGPALFDKYMRAYGVGEKTGFDLPGEEKGLLMPLSQWSGISIARMPIGQGVAVTALQLLNIYSTIANGGVRMKPFVVKKVRHPDGRILLDRRPQEVARPITPETAAVMRRLLIRVTEDGGTARRARVAGYEVAGKTGTAQKPAPGGYSSTDYMATFVGFLPARTPEIAMVVTLDNPQPYHQGGVVAAPVFAKIAEQAMRYLAIPPEGNTPTSFELENDTVLPLED